jgi:hypothetical protein
MNCERDETNRFMKRFEEDFPRNSNKHFDRDLNCSANQNESKQRIDQNIENIFDSLKDLSSFSSRRNFEEKTRGRNSVFFSSLGIQFFSYQG